MIQFNRFQNGKRHCLTFSYDDGPNYDEKLVEIFNRYGMKGTFHLNSGKIGKEGYVRTEQLPNLYCGHEISCHSVSHPFPDRIPLATWTNEIWEDRINLERISSGIVRGMSYPYGVCDKAIVEAAKSCGIVYGRTVMATGTFALPEDFMLWQPTCHHKNCLEYADAFFRPEAYENKSQLFYVWGHSFEFAGDNNWNLIEKFCKKMSNREEIWYATNIEIYDYIQGLKHLQISAKQKTVYNPSATPLWFSNDGKTIKIAGGETLTL